MTFNWTQLKEAITEETLDVFKANSTVSVSEALEIFRKVIDFPVEGIAFNLAGLPDLWQAFTNILVNNDTNLSNFKALATNFEAYLKKILYLTDEAYYTANANNLTLGDNPQRRGLISKLNLNPNGIRYSWSDLDSNQKSNFAEHLWRTYNIRNGEAHFAPPHNKKQYWCGVQSYLVMYLWAAYKHRHELKKAFLKEYLKQAQENYENWIRISFSTSIEGEFKPVATYAKEHLPNMTNKDQQKQPHEATKDTNSNINGQQETKRKEPRSGEIRDLCKKITENQMIIVAEPGMGKTTTLQYIAYSYLQDIQNNQDNATYPVLLELKMRLVNQNVFDSIKDKLGRNFEPEFLKLLLENGDITLLLDGLNETPQYCRTEITHAIRQFMIDYPKVAVIITTRPGAYQNRYFDNLIGRANETPVFQLQTMGLEQTTDFINQFCANPTVKQRILTALEEHEHLRVVTETPLLLKMLITLVEQNPDNPIPISETEIILSYINRMYQWEANQNPSFEHQRTFFSRLLTHVAYDTRMKNESNTAVSEEYLLRFLGRYAQEEIAIQMLFHAVELHLLEKQSDSTMNYYNFAHELYQEALWAKHQVSLLDNPTHGFEFIDPVALWINPSFSRALRLYAGLLKEDRLRQFIHAVAQRNAHLAAQCTTAYWQPEDAIKQLVVERAKLFAAFFEEAPELATNGLLALIELDDYDTVTKMVAVYDASSGYLEPELIEAPHYSYSITGFYWDTQPDIAKIDEVLFKMCDLKNYLHFLQILLNTKLRERADVQDEKLGYFNKFLERLDFPKNNDASRVRGELAALTKLLVENNLYESLLVLEGKHDLCLTDAKNILKAFEKKGPYNLRIYLNRAYSSITKYERILMKYEIYGAVSKKQLLDIIFNNYSFHGSYLIKETIAKHIVEHSINSSSLIENTVVIVRDYFAQSAIEFLTLHGKNNISVLVDIVGSVAIEKKSYSEFCKLICTLGWSTEEIEDFIMQLKTAIPSIEWEVLFSIEKVSDEQTERTINREIEEVDSTEIPALPDKPKHNNMPPKQWAFKLLANEKYEEAIRFIEYSNLTNEITYNYLIYVFDRIGKYALRDELQIRINTSTFELDEEDLKTLNYWKFSIAIIKKSSSLSNAIENLMYYARYFQEEFQKECEIEDVEEWWNKKMACECLLIATYLAKKYQIINSSKYQLDYIINETQKFFEKIDGYYYMDIIYGLNLRQLFDIDKAIVEYCKKNIKINIFNTSDLTLKYNLFEKLSESINTYVFADSTYHKLHTANSFVKHYFNILIESPLIRNEQSITQFISTQLDFDQYATAKYLAIKFLPIDEDLNKRLVEMAIEKRDIIFAKRWMDLHGFVDSESMNKILDLCVKYLVVDVIEWTFPGGYFNEDKKWRIIGEMLVNPNIHALHVEFAGKYRALLQQKPELFRFIPNEGISYESISEMLKLSDRYYDTESALNSIFETNAILRNEKVNEINTYKDSCFKKLADELLSRNLTALKYIVDDVPKIKISHWSLLIDAVVQRKLEIDTDYPPSQNPKRELPKHLLNDAYLICKFETSYPEYRDRYLSSIFDDGKNADLSQIIKLLESDQELLTRYLPSLMKRSVETDIALASEILEKYPEYEFKEKYLNDLLIKSINSNFLIGKKLIDTYGCDKEFADLFMEQFIFGLKETKELDVLITSLENGEITNRILQTALLFQAISLKNDFKKEYIKCLIPGDRRNDPQPCVEFALEKGYSSVIRSWFDHTQNIHEFVNIELLINKALQINDPQIAEYWVKKYNLYAEFPQFEPPAIAQPDATVPPDEA